MWMTLSRHYCTNCYLYLLVIVWSTNKTDISQTKQPTVEKQANTYCLLNS